MVVNLVENRTLYIVQRLLESSLDIVTIQKIVTMGQEVGIDNAMFMVLSNNSLETTQHMGHDYIRGYISGKLNMPLPQSVEEYMKENQVIETPPIEYNPAYLRMMQEATLVAKEHLVECGIYGYENLENINTIIAHLSNSPTEHIFIPFMEEVMQNHLNRFMKGEFDK